MSRPRFYWYGIAKTMIRRYNQLELDNSEQADIFRNAIDKAISETLNMSNGELRMRAINDILINQTKTVHGVMQDTYYEEWTVRTWVSDFIKLVGKHAGLTKRES